MYTKKTGLPKEGELLMCTVTKIQYHSIFVNINEYGIGGMIHISEIAPGRIRNIRDYVKEGKVIVCKVLNVRPDKGHVDLSLRRVSDAQRRQLVDQQKHEKKAENIVDFVAKELKKDNKKLYESIAKKIHGHYEFLFECFEDVVEKDLKLESLGIDKEVASKLEEVIRQRIKPKEVNISGTLVLTTYEGNGVETVMEALKKADKAEGSTLSYLGGGRYKININAKDYKIAEAELEKATTAAISHMQKHNGQASFTKDSK